MRRSTSLGFGFATALLLAGCASSEFTPDLSTGTVAPRQIGSSGYKLTADERKLPCAKLNGRIQMRILAIRHANVQSKPSIVSQGLRSAAEGVGLWSQTAADPAANQSRDVALVRAYNQRLAELRCPTYDLKAELAKTDTADLPRPTRKQ